MNAENQTAATAQASGDSDAATSNKDLSWESLAEKEHRTFHRWRHFNQAFMILRPFCAAASLVALVLASAVVGLALFTVVQQNSRVPAALSACAVMLIGNFFYIIKLARRLDAYRSELSRIQDRTRSLESSERLRRIREIFRKTDDDKAEKDGSVEGGI